MPRLLDGRLKFRHLVLLDALARQGTVVGAVAELHVTQPVATRSLAPMIATAVLNTTGSTTGITWYLAAICGVSMISAMALFRLIPSRVAESTVDGPRDAVPLSVNTRPAGPDDH
ncbi:hypothetical protein BS329_36965 [Amycolatopsis coloradensis]|uniref:Uncharacterized protein n=1 Tax=Amycolatopsis coloradensis TaxID=76021 RepID=A0A1R0KFU8_9PSEU|nr:hypothetical protein [Amycolatopsis coloradensis]OLZ44296.1 hypothetical protein BS329_36965 [Amycolatopsis coloradensis]